MLMPIRPSTRLMIGEAQKVATSTTDTAAITPQPSAMPARPKLLASLAGLVPGAAGHTLYAATKGFLVKFSQSLHLENLSTGVHVSALCPGFTYSEFHDVNGTRAQVSQSLPTWLWLGADEVAAAGYEAAEANRPVCVPGSPNKAIAVLAKLVPDDWALALMASQGSRFRKV